MLERLEKYPDQIVDLEAEGSSPSIHPIPNAQLPIGL